MTEIKKNSFNIEPLVIEIENVIKNGLSVILRDYTDRYDLLEKTNKQIMKLSHLCDLDSGVDSNYDLHDYKNSDRSIDIKDLTRNLVRDEFVSVENKLDRIEKKYELVISPLIDKIMDKLESLNNEIKVLKVNNTNHTHDKINSFSLKPSIVSACENENIKFEIDEEYVSTNEDLNPDPVACSQIIIKQEKTDVAVDLVEKENFVNQIKEEDELSVEKVLDIQKEQTEEDEVETEEEVTVQEDEEEVQEDEVETEEEEVQEDEEEVQEDEVETEEEEVQEDEVKVEPTKTEPEEDEDELTIITIDDIDYCTNDEENGLIYELSEEGEQGDKIGYLKEGEPFFYADEK